uniref:Sodium channel neurotoxin n=1 Tax=Urticina crassicornis TaxID=45621 RepID=D0VLT9_URTCR|nr:sodium channel neurotoxin [Urticina crassicornis]
MASLKIVLVALMLLYTVSARRLSAPEEEKVIEKRIPCRCDIDGPSVRGTLSGSVDPWNCNTGWKKCTSFYTAVASCCLKVKG